MRDKTEQINIIYWVLAIMVAFYSGSALSVISSTYRNSIILVAAIFVIIRVLERRFKVPRTLRTLFFGIFAVMILTTAVATQYSMFYLRLFTTICLAYEISERFEGRVLIDVYMKLMTLVTVVALIGYFAVNVLGIGNVMPEFTNINGEILDCLII